MSFKLDNDTLAKLGIKICLITTGVAFARHHELYAAATLLVASILMQDLEINQETCRTTFLEQGEDKK